MSKHENPRQSPLVSCVESEGAIIETIYHPTEAKTAFVVSLGSIIEERSEWETDEAVCVPLSPGNNLLRHQALLLPSGPEEYGTTEELLATIQRYIAEYVSLSPQALGVSAAYVLLSWVYDAFNELPYLRFRGDYGTGKTRALLVIGSLCYKAFFASGASTVSPIFHILDTFKGTLIFDEADFRFTDEKSELVKILNNGNVKGFPVLRTHVTQQKEFDPRAFAIFGPKIVGMRHWYQDRALESRFLTVEMEPGHSGRAPINLVDAQRDEALHLRNMLLMYRLRNRLSVRPDPRLVNPRLEPRLNQVLLPLLSVVPTEELRNSIWDTASVHQENMISERGESTEGKVLGVLAQLLSAERDAPLSLSAVTAAFTADYGGDYEKPANNRWIGSILRRLGIRLYKSNGIFVLVPGQHQRLTALGERYGVTFAPTRADVGEF